MDEYAAWLIGELEAIGEPRRPRRPRLGRRLHRARREPAPRPRALVGHRRRGSRRRRTSSGTTSPRSGRRRARARRSGRACSRLRAADRAAGLVGGGMPQDDALVAAEALESVDGVVHPRPLPVGHEGAGRVGPGLRRHPEARHGHRAARGRVPGRRWREERGEEGRSARDRARQVSATGGCSKTPSAAPPVLEEFWDSV